jgi:arylsulfatase A-like enzyme/Flp pilus assembly protein TadD
LFVLMAMVAAALGSSACGDVRFTTWNVVRRPIVLITIDTLRADHVNAKVAPALDRLARESIAFDTAISVGPLTLPGHASLLTGLFPPGHGLRDNHLYSLPKEAATYPAWLKTQGYKTGAFVSSIVLDKRYGLDTGFDTYDDVMPDGGPERSAQDTLQRAAQWLTSQAAVSGRSEASGTRAPPEPFFLWIHLFEPHAPYKTGSYAGEVSAVDRELDRFFTLLRERGLWNDIVLSVTSDHGESLGEHGEATHGFYVYDSTIRIPWILKAPGQTARRVGAQVRLVDVMPTMIGLAEIAVGTMPPIPGVHGEDLVPYLTNGGFPSLEAYSETFLPRNQFNWSELKAIRGYGSGSGGSTGRGDYKFIDAPEPELYALAQDHAEAKNIIANASEATRVAAMKKIITGLEQDSKAVASAATRRQSSDIVEAEKFVSLGYIGQSSPAATTSAPGVPLPDPKKKLAIYQLVMSSIELNEAGKADEALAALKRAAAMDASVTQVHYLQGLILGGQQRYKEAAAALERTIALNPRHVLARFKLALAWLRLNRTAEAEKALKTVLEDEPRNVRAYHNLAAIAYSRGDLRRAESLERQALAIDGNYFEAWNTLGAIYVVEKRAAEALQAMNKATALRPSSGQAQYNLALALQAAGNLDAAQAAADKACSLEQRYCQ